MGLHPLVSMVARPVKHVRLVTALLKAIALMRSKAQVQPLALLLSYTPSLLCHVLLHMPLRGGATEANSRNRLRVAQKHASLVCFLLPYQQFC